jgi:hypothetical protein
MTTLNEIVDTILNLYNGGRISQSYRPTRLQVKYIVKYIRATLLRRDLDKDNLNPNTFFWQYLGCQELELVDEAECCGIELGCKILRTKDKLPTPIRGKMGDFLKIYTIDRKTQIPIKRPEEIDSYISGNQFTGKTIVATIVNGRAYFYNTKTLAAVTPAGLFEDPTVAANYVNCDGVACYSDDDEFPIPADMIQQLIQMILTGEMKILATTPEDTTTDLQK